MTAHTSGTNSKPTPQELHIDLPFKVAAKSNEIQLAQAEVAKLAITSVRTQGNFSLPVSALCNKSVYNHVGVASAQVSLPENAINVDTLSITLPELKTADWELTGVTVAVRAFNDSQTTFSSSDIQNSKSSIRQAITESGAGLDHILDSITAICNDEE